MMMTALRNVTRTTLAEEAARVLEEAIQSGEWPEGTKIPSEAELMEQLGISRNTVREAVRALSHLGMLEARPGDGTYVRSKSVLSASLSRHLEGCAIRDTLEAFRSLKREAALLAARRHTAEDLEGLRAGLVDIEGAIGREASSPEIADLLFEQELRMVRASGNALLIELFESIAERLRAALGAIVETKRSLQGNGQEDPCAAPEAPSVPRAGSQQGPNPGLEMQRTLVEAIARRDSEEVGRLMAFQEEKLNSLLEFHEGDAR